MGAQGTRGGESSLSHTRSQLTPCLQRLHADAVRATLFDGCDHTSEEPASSLRTRQTAASHVCYATARHGTWGENSLNGQREVTKRNPPRVRAGRASGAPGTLRCSRSAGRCATRTSLCSDMLAFPCASLRSSALPRGPGFLRPGFLPGIRGSLCRKTCGWGTGAKPEPGPRPHPEAEPQPQAQAQAQAQAKASAANASLSTLADHIESEARLEDQAVSPTAPMEPFRDRRNGASGRSA